MQAHGSPDWTNLVNQSAQASKRLRTEAPKREGIRISIEPRFVLYALFFIGAFVLVATR